MFEKNRLIHPTNRVSRSSRKNYARTDPDAEIACGFYSQAISRMDQPDHEPQRSHSDIQGLPQRKQSTEG
ncbi:MAG: hypothetical protein HFG20_02000 [Anaerotruncus sp.]|nr:hypothetical protein [Anaerotruncus sp.]